MRQIQFEYTDYEALSRQLNKIKQWCRSAVTSNILFTIFSESLDKDKIERVCEQIKGTIPEAEYIGCSTNGNILNGELSQSELTICCTIFEYPSTEIKILQYTLTPQTEHKVTTDLLREVSRNPWVNSIQILTTIRGMSMTGFCERLSALRENINVFGGGAFSPDMDEQAALVFSSEGECSDHAIVFTLMGGPDFYTYSDYITGWKPLGRELKVTKAKGNILYELDGLPAYETYYKYLNIKNDENFFQNTLEFPFLYDLNGISILRAPTGANPDGSITMTSDMAENVQARIAYGDPWTILTSVSEQAKKMAKFQPEAIVIFSCAARRTFWGSEESSKETMPFQLNAPTSGFYTSGEFLRTNGYVNQHNVTLVITTMREGEISESFDDTVYNETHQFSGHVSMINRLATFIQAATDELAEANDKLAEANRSLEKIAITDRLTGLLNRGEIQNRITNAIIDDIPESVKDGEPSGYSLIMIDIDNFKKVNDTYGHKEGDIVLRGLADLLTSYMEKNKPESSIGRWGGEEFMILLPNCSQNKAFMLAENIRSRFSEIKFPNAGHCTMSLGVTEAKKGENPDTICMRADSALYDAKGTGKNRTMVR